MRDINLDEGQASVSEKVMIMRRGQSPCCRWRGKPIKCLGPGGQAEAGPGKGQPFGPVDAGCHIFHQAYSRDCQVRRSWRKQRKNEGRHSVLLHQFSTAPAKNRTMRVTNKDGGNLLILSLSVSLRWLKKTHCTNLNYPGDHLTSLLYFDYDKLP